MGPFRIRQTFTVGPLIHLLRLGATASAILLSTAALILDISSAAAAAGPRVEPFEECGAVVVSVTESDLNSILKGSIHSLGGPVFEGQSQDPSKGIYDLRYKADISQPVLKLGADGKASIAFSIREGNLRIGRYEKRIAGRMASCENLGVSIDPDQPVDVSLGLHFAIDGRNLEIVPDRVSMPDAAKRLRLIRPTRCEHTPLPRWLLWWVGKPQIKKRLGTIDDVLLASVKKSASRWGDGKGLFGKHWDLGPEDEPGPGSNPAAHRELYLYPGSIDTSRGALRVSLTASSASRSDQPSAAPVWVAPDSDRSFLAVSEPFLGELARYAFTRISTLPRKPSGILKKILKSDELYALIPGLRGIEGKEKIRLALKTSAPPEVELRELRGDAFQAAGSSVAEASDTDIPAAGTLPVAAFSSGTIVPRTSSAPGATEAGGASGAMSRAEILIHLSGLRLEIWQPADSGERLLGSVTIDSGHIGLSPYANSHGGVSFDLVENDWKVSSTGMEFNEDLFAATIQEVVFGEAFASRYEPLLRDGLGLGETQLIPKTFRVAENHLIIEFGS